MKKKLLLFFLLLLLVGGCSKKKKELVLVTEAGFAPYEYYENGEIVGVDIDICKRIANELGMDLKIKDVSFDSIINEVKTKKSDIGAAGISQTKERAREVDFTNNYMESKQVLIVKRESHLKSPSMLSDEKIAVQLGTTADTYLTEKVPTVRVIREKKFLAAIQDLIDDKVSGVVMDEVPAKELITDDMIILDEPLVIDYYGMVVRKGNKKLLSVANKVIDEMKENGSIDEILLEHLGVKEKVSKKNSIIDKFYYSVIYDGRYKYIFEGILNTIIIALGAVVLGVLFGGITSIIRNINGNTGKLKILNLLAKGYVTIIRGTPVILQLMIIYYVIFKSAQINIVLVGILAFGINSGAYVAEIIRAGIQSVDKGQIEAGYALGLPYIGIIELTKASDIIASRTYDYFFPLILVALIYLLITLVLTKVFNTMEERLNHVRN